MLHGLGADAGVEHGHVLLEVNVEEVVSTVGLEDVQTGTEFRRAEERDGAADMGLQFQEVAEGFVFQDVGLEVSTVHGGKRAEATVDCNVVGRDYFFVVVR